MEWVFLYKAVKGVVICALICTLGVMVRSRKRPVIIRPWPVLTVFVLLAVINSCIMAIRPSGFDPEYFALSLTVMLVLAALLKMSMGDFQFYNVTVEALEEALGQTLGGRGISYQETATRGLLAPGGETRERKIVTLRLEGMEAFVRYLVGRRTRIGFVRFINKANIPEGGMLLEELKQRLRSMPVEPGSTPVYYFAIGALAALLALINLMKYVG